MWIAVRDYVDCTVRDYVENSSLTVQFCTVRDFHKIAQ